MIFKLSTLHIYQGTLQDLPLSKLLISTINAYSFNVAQNDVAFAEALINSDILLPDGVSIVLAMRFLKGVILKKIAGADLFYFEMNRLNEKGGTCFFMGSNEQTLKRIYENALNEFPNVKVYSYSPPYKSEFSTSDNQKIISAINSCKPDVLFIGMTAPKQEKWAYKNIEFLNVGHVCCIGAVFDFYSGRIKRAPERMIRLGLEWFFRLYKEPRRLWRRYLIGNFKFIKLVIKEKPQTYKSNI
jgi:N-acetylglucosaminyldiphosphoundecaprenol N-acetyl-beta-D-mannosaminyltransferase